MSNDIYQRGSRMRQVNGNDFAGRGSGIETPTASQVLSSAASICEIWRGGIIASLNLSRTVATEYAGVAHSNCRAREGCRQISFASLRSAREMRACECNISGRGVLLIIILMSRY